MDTPARPDRSRILALYGDLGEAINRRLVATTRRGVLAGVLTLPIAARAAQRGDGGLAARALAAMGGTERLAAVRALRWDGHARVVTDEVSLGLSVQTRVEPFVRAVSRSWITREGSWTARTLTVDATGGRVERDGTTTPLPEQQARHEIDQYAIYGHLLLAQSQLHEAGGEIVSERPGFPPIRFALAPDGLPARAHYRLASPHDASGYEETIAFEGRAPGADTIAWPARMTISNPGMVFTLTIDAFGVEFA